MHSGSIFAALPWWPWLHRGYQRSKPVFAVLGYKFLALADLAALMALCWQKHRM
ncbi:hypothetical protein BDW60DRAFT_193383, partial [Aspergillus nidulans var. acristatus]